MSIAVAAASGQPGLYTPSMRRRVIAGTTIGNALEFFDFTVFTFLMLVIGPLFFPAASGYGQLLLTRPPSAWASDAAGRRHADRFLCRPPRPARP